ncbi:MAG: DoxX family membrane protein [Bacteroidetes bacterium]|nr:DoxX family membrane protein [Bacteroidota bacterium]MCW5895948.1 DoxX family membrane protein [Bacteroidota bacterium]
MKRILDNDFVAMLVRVFLGFVFIVAAVDKAADPNAFAVSIGYYKLAGPDTSLLIATVLPWMELLCGIFLIFGYMPRGSTLLVLLMLVVFTAGVIAGIIRNLDISCGCFSRDPAVGKIGWMKVLENTGLIVLSVISLFSRSERTTVSVLSYSSPEASDNAKKAPLS